MQVIHTLKPIYDSHSQVLILGSMPSVISRHENFYYANKQNRFWKIFEIIFDINLNSNQEKTNFLLQNHIALWDAFSACEINGSSDSSIKRIKLNNIDLITKNAPIKVIFCTGKTAYNSIIKNYKTNIPIFYLPSPSSANATFKLETLVTKYSQILKYLKR